MIDVKKFIPPSHSSDYMEDISNLAEYIIGAIEDRTVTNDDDKGYLFKISDLAYEFKEDEIDDICEDLADEISNSANERDKILYEYAEYDEDYIDDGEYHDDDIYVNHQAKVKINIRENSLRVII